MIKVEEKHCQETNRHRDEDPFDGHVPEIHKPTSIDGGIECSGMGQCLDMRSFQRPRNVRESSPEDSGDLSGH